MHSASMAPTAGAYCDPGFRGLICASFGKAESLTADYYNGGQRRHVIHFNGANTETLSHLRSAIDLPNRLHLRVEVQHMLCLRHSGAVLFLIRSYLLPLSDIAQVPLWRERLGHVLTEFPEDMAEYKGISRYRKAASDWLLA